MSSQPIRDEEAFNELSLYTPTHQGPSFIHQIIVDTFAVQHAMPDSKPVYAAFGLAGLYLHNEHAYTGKQVQRVHTDLARLNASRPRFMLPNNRGALSVYDALNAPAGEGRDATIEQWSKTTWNALPAELQREVALWIENELGIR